MGQLFINPQQPFYDDRGRPLKNGVLIFGEENKDPLNFPRSVQNQAGESIGNRITLSTAGTQPSDVFLPDSNYSLRVEGRRGYFVQTFDTLDGAQLFTDDVQNILDNTNEFSAMANNRGNWPGLTGALAVPASVYHNGNNWQLLSNLADVTTAEPGVSSSWALLPNLSTDNLQQYATLSYSPSDSSSAIDNMVAGTPLAAAVGDVVSTGRTVWVRTALSNPSVLSDFQAQTPINVRDFGAVGNGVANDTAAIQSAVNVGSSVYIPTGRYIVSSVTISQQIVVTGDGINSTFILPLTGNSTFVVATDNVTISDLEFFGQSGTGQADITGSCIEFNAVDNNPAFVRHMEGCKVERVQFRNLKMNGIFIPHLLRESHIRECRFVGMGDLATSASPIRARQTVGTPSNTNNLWIVDNMFFRFATPAINLERSTLITPDPDAAPSFADIHIRGNLIHGQLLDETTIFPGVSVEPEQTHQVVAVNATNMKIIDNTLTACHPLSQSIRIVSGGDVSKSIIILGNDMSLTPTVRGTTYGRTTSPNATGYFMFLQGFETCVVSKNQLNAGTYVNDILLNNGTIDTRIDIDVSGNVSQAGFIAIDRAGLGLNLNGVIEDGTDRVYFGKDVEFEGISGKNGFSTFSAANNGLALRLLSAVGQEGCFIGSRAASSFTVSTNGGGALFNVVPSGIHPESDNTYQCGSPSNRFSQVYAGNSTINTSDEREKTEFGFIDDAERAAALEIKANLKKFKWLDAIEEKGDEARWHFGAGAQTVGEILKNHGLNPEAYGFFCYDEWGEQLDDDGIVIIESGNRYGVRYGELSMFILMAL